MNFVSLMFALFLVGLFLLSVWLPSKYRKMLLLLASYLFYATWSIPFIAVILVTTTIDYWCTQLMAKAGQTQQKKRFYLIAGIVINLLILAWFKYANFGLASVHSLADMMHWPLALPQALDIILPLGISFYTFEAISYLVDVYRGKPAAENWLDYNFYIMYFPHLISGPIIRYQELQEQYGNLVKFPTPERLLNAVGLIVLGVVFKVAIADWAATYAEPVFSNPAAANVLATYLGVLGFTVQIYFDFMGYTHIARGASLLFNLELPQNFNHPYNASNISDFWQRWHMSLSRWIRDYLYFPLGGSRGALVQTCLNLLITMLIAGAWHGAGWTFIAWGGFHGVYLGVYHLYQHYRNKCLGPKGSEVLQANRFYHLGSVVLTFAAVVVGWVLFRAATFTDALTVFAKLTHLEQIPANVLTLIESKHIADLPALLILLLCCFVGPKVITPLVNWFKPLPFWAKAQWVCVVLILCWILHADTVVPFIYFQF